MFATFSYVRDTIKGAIESLVWEFTISILEITASVFAYIKVILKRSELRNSGEYLMAANTGVGFNYVQTDRLLREYGYTEFGSLGSQTATPVENLRLAAQVLLLNSKNSASFGHSFHVISPSQLPVLFALTVGSLVFFLLMGLRASYHGMFAFAHCVVLAAFVSIIVGWILMAFREEIGGAHTLEVQQSFRIGIVLFIASELMLFFAFFWAFFHFCLNPSAVTNGQFVAEGIVPFFWYRIPLLNTVILLSSGISLTLAHGLLAQSDRATRATRWLSLLIASTHVVELDSANTVESNEGLAVDSTAANAFVCDVCVSGYVYSHAFSVEDEADVDTNFAVASTAPSFLLTSRGWLLDTVLRGAVFLTLQAYEYISGLFTIADSVYGGVFYSLTGLHGLHVFVGVLMLMGALIFDNENPEVTSSTDAYRSNWWYHRVAFDGVAWYWHFVDVVWLFVFIFVYWYSFPTNYIV